MRIHFICPVRMVTPEMQKEIDDYAAMLVAEGHEVHNPKYAVNQNASGFDICVAHKRSMVKADRIDIFWMEESKGSHFDLGMAFALRKPVKLVKVYGVYPETECYARVADMMHRFAERGLVVL
jgi:hypothetical protein